MSLSVSTSLQSMQSYNSLASNQNSQGATLGRLSSGVRIERTGDPMAVDLSARPRVLGETTQASTLPSISDARPMRPTAEGMFLASIDSGEPVRESWRSEAQALNERLVRPAPADPRADLPPPDSRLADEDKAREAVNLTKVQILQQSSVSSLAVANQSAQSVLSLLL